MANEFDFYDDKDGGNQSRSSQTIDPVLILIKVARNWPLVVVSVLLGLLVMFTYHRYATERYSVRGSIVIPETNTTVATDFLQDFIGGGFAPNFLNELEVLRSEAITRSAIDSLDFRVEYFSKGRIKSVEEYNTLPFEVIETANHRQLYNREFLVTFYENNQFRLTFADDDNHEESNLFPPNSLIQNEAYSFSIFFNRSVALNGKSYTFRFRDRESLVTEWNRRLNVTYLREFTTIAVLSLNHTEPRKGASFINAAMNAYRDQELDRKNAVADKTINYINRELSVLDDTLSIYENQLDRVKVQERTLTLDNIGDKVLNKLERLEQERVIGNASLSSLKENLQFLNDTAQYQKVFLPLTIAENRGLNTYINRLQELLIQKNDLLEKLSPINELVKAKEYEIASLVDLIRNSSEIQISDLEKEIARLDMEIEKGNVDFKNYPEKQRRLSDIQRIYNVYVASS